MKKILCFGDSNTYGYDPQSFFGGRYEADVRWTGLLEADGWTVVNCGQNGLSIPGERNSPVMKRLIQSKLPVDLVTVMLGSNDLLEGATAETAALRMERFLPCITETVSESPVILIAPPVMKPGAWVQNRKTIDESSRLSGQYRQLAERAGLLFADAENWGVELSYDGVHFTPKGHRAFAAGLKHVIGAAVERNGEN